MGQVCTLALGTPFRTAQYRDLPTLSGGEQKRLVLEALLRGLTTRCCCSTSPTTTSTCPASSGSRRRCAARPRRCCSSATTEQLLARAADRIVTIELGAAGNTVWTHGGGFATYADARDERTSRLAELRRRWDDEHEQLVRLVLNLQAKAAANNDGLASRYQAAQTRLAKFEEAGPPQEVPRDQRVSMRLGGGRTGKRAVICERLELTGLMHPFDLEVWFGERVAVLGANGSGKSHFLRLLAGGSDPTSSTAGDEVGRAVRTPAWRGSARASRPGWFAQTHDHPELVGRTLLDILHRGDGEPRGHGREHEAARVLDRYELAYAARADASRRSRAGSRRASRSCCSSSSGATLLLLDEPTDNLDLASAEALEHGLAGFEGTVLAVTHDRWFARDFDRFVVFRADGTVVESTEPVWDEPGARSRGNARPETIT